MIFGSKILRKLLSVFSNMILGIQNSKITAIGFLKKDFGNQNSEKTAIGFLKKDFGNQNSEKTAIGFLKYDFGDPKF
jgi:hypothetical protein